MTSKTLFAVIGLAAFVVTPALAAKKHVHHVVSGPYASANTVQTGTSTLGTDPDARIRFELQRDSDTAEGVN